jgi:hypothetical protein
MDNKQLIKQYVDTGLALPKEQFYKLNNNQKTTYIRKRNIAVDNGSDPKSYELKYLSEDVRIKIIVTDPYYYYNYLERSGGLTDYIILECVKRKPSIIQYVNNPSEEVQLEGVKHTGYNIEYLYNPAEVVQIAAVKNSAIALSHIQNPSEEVQLAAVRSHSLALGTIFSKGITPSENVVTSAIILNPINAIYHLREYDVLISEELKMMAVNINGKSIQFMYNPSEELQLAAIKNSLYAFGNIKNPTEKARLLYSKKYPNHIKAYPLDESKGYNGMKLLDIVDEITKYGPKRDYWSFEKAREYVRSLNLRNVDEYYKLRKPKELPSKPDITYKGEWKGFGDWLGTNKIDTRTLSKQFLPFEEAREYVRNLKLRTVEEWWEYCKSGKKPLYIPSAPERIYTDKWISYGDFLGTFRLFNKHKGEEFWPFEKAREYVRGLNFKSTFDYRDFAKSDKRPKEIPFSPDDYYRDEFKGYGDFLGTDRIDTRAMARLFLPFEEARSYVRKLNLRTRDEYYRWAKNKPNFIPYQPPSSYKGKGWINWYDWLVGSPRLTDKEFNKQYKIDDKPKKYVSFLVARDMARDLNLNSKEEWYQYVKDNKPKGIPIKPQEFYKELWTDWNDFLNIEN